jgi:hypothetical protein
MLRHLWRTATSLIALGVSLVFLPTGAQAQGFLGGQTGILDDPFTFYYAFYLPNQQQQALRATPMDTLNQAVAERQFYARNNIRSVTNPISPYANQQDDPLRPYSRQQGGERIARPYMFSPNPSNSDGAGPSLYYGRAAAYFPGLREGHGRNANVYVRRTRGRPGMGGGGAGMGGMGGMGGGTGMPALGGMGGGMGMM